MDSSLEKITFLAKRYIESLRPKIDVDDMSVLERTNWHHDYKVMCENGVMERVCLIVSEIGNFKFNASMNSYSPDAVLIATANFANSTHTIYASPDSIVLTRRYPSKLIKMTITNAKCIDAFVLIDLFKENTSTMHFPTSTSKSLEEYINKKKLSEHVSVKITKY